MKNKKTGEIAVMQKKVNNIPKNVSAIMLFLLNHRNVNVINRAVFC